MVSLSSSVQWRGANAQMEVQQKMEERETVRSKYRQFFSFALKGRGEMRVVVKPYRFQIEKVEIMNLSTSRV